jgi:hypothetical protein
MFFVKDKGRTARTVRPYKTTNRRNHIRSRIKEAIMRLALWGILPAAVAHWLIRAGGLRHA